MTFELSYYANVKSSEYDDYQFLPKSVPGALVFRMLPIISRILLRGILMHNV